MDFEQTFNSNKTNHHTDLIIKLCKQTMRCITIENSNFVNLLKYTQAYNQTHLIQLHTTDANITCLTKCPKELGEQTATQSVEPIKQPWNTNIENRK